LVCGLSGPDCLARPDAEAALAWFDRAVEPAPRRKPDAFAALSHLLRGQLLDVLGRRDDAVAEYRRTAALPDVDLSRKRAAACLAAPCGRQEVLLRLRALSKGEDLASTVGNGIVTPAQ
jgi:hypothetical protein